MIYPLAKIIHPENVEIGDHCKIDDFTFISCEKTQIGNHVHIASFVSIIGGGEIEVEDYVAIACGARLMTGTNKHQGGYHMSAAAPKEQQNVIRGKITLKKDVFVGTNAIILPNIIISEGAVIGAGCLVRNNIPAWSINVGVPSKIIGYRQKVKFE